jgi:hypothetical protein
VGHDRLELSANGLRERVRATWLVARCFSRAFSIRALTPGDLSDLRLHPVCTLTALRSELRDGLVEGREPAKSKLRGGPRPIIVALAAAIVCAIASPAEAQPADSNRANREAMQFFTDSQGLGSSCEDIAQLRTLAQGKGATAAKLYTDEAERRRQAAVRQLLAVGVPPQEVIATWTAQALRDSPDGDGGNLALPPLPTLAKARDALEAVRCYTTDQTQVNETEKTLDALNVHMQKMIADEQACRVTPACMGPRVAAVACAWLAQRRDIMAAIATEKANPAGVVDVVKLHDYGQHAQQAGDAAADARRRYTAMMHKPFTEALCN